MNVNQVILVDDDEVVNFFGKMVLGKLGLKDKQIKVFENAATALRYLDGIQQDSMKNVKGVILLDIQMPELDGWDFLNLYQNLSEELRKHYSLIILTGDKNEYLEEKSKYGHLLHAVLQKPLTLQMFEQIVETAGTRTAS